MSETIPHALADSLSVPAAAITATPLRSGPIETGRLEHSGAAFFYKRAPDDQAGPLHAEADGLERLARHKHPSVPKLAACIDAPPHTWLVLEWIDLQPLSGAGAVRLGTQLATLHREATSARFGLERDNWIGATPQVNTPSDDWTAFFFEHRIGALIDRLAARGTDVGPEATPRLRDAWTGELSGYRPTPSLLHGDLWGGNAGQRPDGRPIMFDPAVHYGDRECDLAMASLFGGFGPSFFDAYEAAWPLEPGWELRRAYYQLYHVLNHALLFGGGYIADARRRTSGLIDR